MPRLKFYGNITPSNTVRTTALGATSLISALALLLIPAMPANADQSPVGCNGNRLNTSIIKNKTAVYQGDTIIYTVTVSNLDSGSDLACDITNATVQVTLPAADGTPTGSVVTLATGVDYLAGTGLTVVGTVPYVVNVNPDVVDIVAQVSANGTLHDAPTNHSASIVKTLGTSVLVAPTGPSGGSGSSTGTTIPGLPNTGSRS